MSECTHNCETCSSKGTCGESNASLQAAANQYSNVKKVIGVVSGKGGVGKSLVTSLLASALRKKGYNVGILDADVTGPSIPKIFGVTEKAHGNGEGLLPAVSKSGIKIMSVNMLLESEDDPVVWRGPVISGIVKQFWTDVIWDEVDYMLVDMPPGTGDVALTVFQSLPVDGVVIVSTPQSLVSMIVGKAVKMAQIMKMPVLALVENMSGFLCPDCGKVSPLFGKSSVKELAEHYNIANTAALPMNPELAAACDAGKLEEFDCEQLADVVAVLEACEKKQAE